MSLEARFSGDLPAECQADEVEFLGWRGIRLANDLVSLVVVPDLGGRVMSLTLGTHEYLFRNPEHFGKLYSYDENLGDGSMLAWKNYGGDKSWPAPQGWDGEGQWAGPPDPVLDTGRYSATIWHEGQRVGVKMVSPPDQRSGLRISRSVSIAPGTAEVRLDIEFENISDRPVRWAIWDVTQMDCSRTNPAGIREGNPDAWLYIPTPGLRDTGVPYRVLFGGENSQWVPDVGPNLLGVRYLGNVAKIGVRSSAGWVAFADNATGHVFCPQFEYEPGAEYPDGGSSVECWTESPGAQSELDLRSAGFIMEVELLDPLRTLEPGARTTKRVRWGLARCSGPVLQVGPAGCVREPLKATAHAGSVRVTGEFGAFVVGDGTLECLDVANRVLASSPAGAVTPLAPLTLDRSFAIPTGAVRLRLVVQSQAVGVAETIAMATIEWQ